MKQVINITDKLTIRNLEGKILRFNMEIDVHLKTIEHLRTENFRVFAQNSRLKEEIEELKKLLKAVDIGVTYG